RKPVTLKVGRETAGRRGKGVTTVFDIPPDDDGVRELAALLKQRCGTGGTVKDGRIEIQGDQRERIVAELERLGYKGKRVGGWTRIAEGALVRRPLFPSPVRRGPDHPSLPPGGRQGRATCLGVQDRPRHRRALGPAGDRNR